MTAALLQAKAGQNPRLPYEDLSSAVRSRLLPWPAVSLKGRLTLGVMENTYIYNSGWWETKNLSRGSNHVTTALLPTTPTHCASPSLEPEETKDATNAHLFLEDLSDGHACINELLSSLITDAGHEWGRFADQTQFLSRHRDKET